MKESMEAACIARTAGATVAVVRPWTDNMHGLESTVAELRLAGANLVGAVLVSENQRMSMMTLVVRDILPVAPNDLAMI